MGAGRVKIELVGGPHCGLVREPSAKAYEALGPRWTEKHVVRLGDGGTFVCEYERRVRDGSWVTGSGNIRFAYTGQRVATDDDWAGEAAGEANSL